MWLCWEDDGEAGQAPNQHLTNHHYLPANDSEIRMQEGRWGVCPNRARFPRPPIPQKFHSTIMLTEPSIASSHPLPPSPDSSHPQAPASYINHNQVTFHSAEELACACFLGTQPTPANNHVLGNSGPTLLFLYPSAGVTGKCTCFYIGAGDLNSHPLAFAVSTLTH